MKRKIVIFILLLFLILFLIINNNKESNVILEKKYLGYCPTMKEYAINLSKENNYSLIEFENAAQVLENLNNKKIDFGLIGRKAKNIEINEDISLEILKSGYTLINKDRNFIDVSNISNIEVFTYLSDKDVLNNFNYLNIIYFDQFQEIYDLLKEDKVILISWDDWENDFELLVVYDGNLKFKDFRGSFLYFYK